MPEIDPALLAISDADTITVAQGSIVQKRSAFADVKMWIQGWITKASVGLANVPDVDATNAANIATGTLPDARLSAAVARRNAANDFQDNIIQNARGPVVEIAGNTTLGAGHKGAYVHIDSASLVSVTLPNDWLPGAGAVLRRVGSGDVLWAVQSGATVQLPASRASHTKIAEQHAEIFVRVIANGGGSAAVWAIEGATAE